MKSVSGSKNETRKNEMANFFLFLPFYSFGPPCEVNLDGGFYRMGDSSMNVFSEADRFLASCLIVHWYQLFIWSEQNLFMFLAVYFWHSLPALAISISTISNLKIDLIWKFWSEQCIVVFQFSLFQVPYGLVCDCCLCLFFAVFSLVGSIFLNYFIFYKIIKKYKVNSK